MSLYLNPGGSPRGRVALICHYVEGRGIEVTYWPSSDEARQALAELTPCGPRCIDVHTVVNIDPTRRHEIISGTTAPKSAFSIRPAG
ncbi:hypothetical protein BST11_21070 [Mycobacterium alsense]|uniref:Uncharacterized protein n=1 Tax=Mycobacterium alsense TaxID=324058 RepID=A0AA42BX90_9MYCO|nr:hypothetical protein [Mycobacterium alsense]MCV7377951.1 hypothetical protein [Mycobacterium alsense]OQZ88817.1 hypothetical protein BST11_21070 [Mycobacterium alsense]